MGFKVRDKRSVGFYRIDNELVDIYGAKIGAYGYAVYNVLTRCADNDSQQAYPGLEHISDRIGCSTRQVRRTIKTLASLGLIRIQRETTDSGLYWHNIYTLGDIKAGEKMPKTLPVVESPTLKPQHIGQAPRSYPPATQSYKQNSEDRSQSNEIWDLALQELRLTMSKNAYARWLSGSTAVEVAPNVLDVEICDSYAKRWLETRLQFDVERRVSGIAGRAIGIVWHVR